MSDFHKRRNALYAEFPLEAAEYESEFSELQARLDEEIAIVNRIWDIYGSPTYEQLAGRSIYDLINADRARLDVFDRIAARNAALWEALDSSKSLEERRAALERALSERPELVRPVGRL